MISISSFLVAIAKCALNMVQLVTCILQIRCLAIKSMTSGYLPSKRMKLGHTERRGTSFLIVDQSFSSVMYQLIGFVFIFECAAKIWLFCRHRYAGELVWPAKVPNE